MCEKFKESNINNELEGKVFFLEQRKQELTTERLNTKELILNIEKGKSEHKKLKMTKDTKQ